MATKKTVHRDSSSGEFTTRDKAAKSPSATEKERIPLSGSYKPVRRDSGGQFTTSRGSTEAIKEASKKYGNALKRLADK